MRVEEAGQQRLARAVDALVAVESGTDLDDPAVLDDDVGLRERGARPVEDPPAGEHRPCLRSSSTVARLPSAAEPRLGPTAARGRETRAMDIRLYPRGRAPCKSRARAFCDQVLVPLEDECEEHDGLTAESLADAKRAVLEYGFHGDQPLGRTTAASGYDTFQQVLVEEEWGTATGALWDIPWRPSIPLAAATEAQKDEYLRPALPGRAPRLLRDHRGGRRLGPDHGRDDRRSARATPGSLRRHEMARDHRRRRRLLPRARPRRRRSGEGDRLPGRQGPSGRPRRAHAEVHAHVRVRAPDLRVRGRARGRRTRCSARSGRASSSRRTGSSRSAS